MESMYNALTVEQINSVETQLIDKFDHNGLLQLNSTRFYEHRFMLEELTIWYHLRHITLSDIIFCEVNMKKILEYKDLTSEERKEHNLIMGKIYFGEKPTRNDIIIIKHKEVKKNELV